jgi:hypothetical protein
MKKMFVVALLAAAFAIGCKKQQAPTTPPTGGSDTKTEMKGTGGDTYGGAKPEGEAPK